jgi:hypothetical protein
VVVIGGQRWLSVHLVHPVAGPPALVPVLAAGASVPTKKKTNRRRRWMTVPVKTQWRKPQKPKMGRGEVAAVLAFATARRLRQRRDAEAMLAIGCALVGKHDVRKMPAGAAALLGNKTWRERVRAASTAPGFIESLAVVWAAISKGLDAAEVRRVFAAVLRRCGVEVFGARRRPMAASSWRDVQARRGQPMLPEPPPSSPEPPSRPEAAASLPEPSAEAAVATPKLADVTGAKAPLISRTDTETSVPSCILGYSARGPPELRFQGFPESSRHSLAISAFGILSN